ncbi:MAG: hypothetical protein EOP05_19085 [Proteobacteria bacterium]|nr:MAG: hypothetical protein EOP05_19085 [Pseudomonadota bacterium]
MGILKSLGDFLFGKDPDIFDPNGRVRHNFTDKKWEQWNDRLKANPEYDWKNHVAKEHAMNPAQKASDPKKS